MTEQHSSLGVSRVETTTPDQAAASTGTRPTGRRRSDRIISASAAMQEVVDQASGLARSGEPVLLMGASGTGRKHIARAIHQWSPRAAGPLVELQLSGISEGIQLRELFGDGTVANPGGLARAAQGSLLIDRVDQLGPAAIARLADAARGIDGTGAPTGARILATAAEGSEAALSDLQAHRLQLVPLAERAEDILPLAAHFLAEFAAEESVEAVGFSADARRWLVEEPWSGNVRELRERIRQAIRLSGQGAISAESLMLSTEGEEVPSFKEAKRAFETRYVEGLLRRCGGNISRAARMAKKDRKDFYDVIRRTGVDPGEFRG